MATVALTAMTTDTLGSATLYRLMAWLSPAYPVGAFSYSHGLEYAIEVGLISNAESTADWLEDVVRFGGARNDAIFLVCAHRAVVRSDRAALREVAELSAAFQPSAELALETSAQGAAFVRATREAWPCAGLGWLVEDWPGAYAYPVAVGAAAAGHGITCEQALPAYLHAFAANLVSAAVRLVPLGQSDGQKIIAVFAPPILETAFSLQDSTLDNLGTATVMVDLCSMWHETQYTRLFRT